MSEIRLLTDGGTPFDAIHKYAPMCNRFTLVIFNKGPSTLETARNVTKKNSLYGGKKPHFLLNTKRIFSIEVRCLTR